MARESAARYSQNTKTNRSRNRGSIVRSTVSWERLFNYTKTVWLHAEPISYLKRVREQGDFRPMEGYSNAISEIEQLLRIENPCMLRRHCIWIQIKSKEELVNDLLSFYRNLE